MAECGLVRRSRRGESWYGMARYGRSRRSGFGTVR